MNMLSQSIIQWLLEGDVSIQYQVWRDLLGDDKKELRVRIAEEGWGHGFLTRRNPLGHWGDRFYQPKWISSHYTLLDLRNLCMAPDHKQVQESIEQVLQDNTAMDGGICLGPSTSHHSDVCVNGMFLNYASYFRTAEKKLESLVNSILNEIMPDGGFNCRSNTGGAVHSSLHTTLSVLEGFLSFQKAGYNYRKNDINRAMDTATEFILLHRLFLSDRTGEIISQEFLRLRYPCRWKYDILRALDYFREAGLKYDNRLEPALDVLYKKRNKDGTWNQTSPHPGQVHFVMEEPGKPGRWNTLRCLRVLNYFA